MPNSQSMAYSAVNSMIQKSVKNSKPYNVIYPAGMMQDSGSGTTDVSHCCPFLLKRAEDKFIRVDKADQLAYPHRS